MSDFKTEKYLPRTLHVLAWLIYLTLVVNGNASRFTFGSFLLHYGPIACANCLIFYLNYSYLTPKLLVQAHLLKFSVINILSMAGLAVLIAVIHQHNHFGTILTRFINVGWFVILSVIVRFSSDWYKKLQADKERENEQLKTELSFLKAQINPHFLFNALNNLYALALKKSDDTPDKILQISSIMRYLLYETNDERIQLSKEIEIIQTYISLHELRNKSGEGIHFEIHGNADEVAIQPLLFLPLVENVFKHGTYPIMIRFEIAQDNIQLRLSNKIRETHAEMQGGVGLQNLQRRLDLLYQKNHKLVLDKTNDVFTVNIILNLHQKP